MQDETLAHGGFRSFERFLGLALVSLTLSILMSTRLMNYKTLLFAIVTSWLCTGVALASQKDCAAEKREIENFIKSNRNCVHNLDCVAVELGCSFGCEAKFLNQQVKSELLRKVDARRVECFGIQCDCGDPTAVAICENGKCIRKLDGLYSTRDG